MYIHWDTAATAKSLQSCLTLCDPIDGSPPGSPDPGILQARTLEWVAISFSNAWKWKVKVRSLSCVRLFTTPWTAAYQAPPSIGFSRQEYWSGVPSPSPDTGILLSHKKEGNNTIWSNMDATRDYHTKRSKSERETQTHMIALYVESKIWHKWTYLWSRNRLTGLEKRLVVAKGGRKGWPGVWN